MVITHLAGDARTLIAVAVILLLTIVAAGMVRLLITRAIRLATQHDDYDPTGLLFSKRIISGAVYVVGLGCALAQIPKFAVLGHSMLAGAGVLTLVAGLASQQVLSNVMSGVLIVIFKPFRLRDRITVNGLTGTVEDMNLREIVLRDADNNRIVIPNAMVSSNAVVNSHRTDPRVCTALEFGIGYASDIDTALAIMVDEVTRHPLHIDPRTPAQIEAGESAVVARVTALGESAVVLKVWPWAKDADDGFVMSCDLRQRIKQRFDAEGIEIPYPQRTISYRDPAAARASAVSPER
ncbi:mechanosensitive ion channel family protein [Salinisphaera hydrothermalis]|uniref:mechanosensitive ion channel family protein n=1 Tax=Salinisphaera hydrothermalis TaxID=563188 RepID=UPI00334076E7